LAENGSFSTQHSTTLGCSVLAAAVLALRARQSTMRWKALLLSTAAPLPGVFIDGLRLSRHHYRVRRTFAKKDRSFEGSQDDASPAALAAFWRLSAGPALDGDRQCIVEQHRDLNWIELNTNVRTGNVW